MILCALLGHKALDHTDLPAADPRITFTLIQVTGLDETPLYTVQVCRRCKLLFAVLENSDSPAVNEARRILGLE